MKSSKEVADFPLTRRSTSQRVDLPPGMLTVLTTQEGVYVLNPSMNNNQYSSRRNKKGMSRLS